jgi:hypothetical protein
MAFKVRVRGIDRYIRDLAKANTGAYYGAMDGVNKAAEYLLEKVVAKIGVYQPTGGMMGGRGRWAKLKPETVWRKLMKYGGSGDRPLFASGNLKESFHVIKGGKGRLSASVGSDSEYLIHHVYGAPGASVPMRDPIRITAVEEMEACHKIIEDEIMKEIDNWW